MKLYLVWAISYEYNDEYYHESDSVISGDNGVLIKAYKNKKNAEEECKKQNKKHLEDDPFYDYDRDIIEEYYRMIEIDVEEDEVTSYSTAREVIKEAKKKAKEIAQKVFKEDAQKLFDQYPALQSFGWRQYTPYFNDGDTCTFGVRNDKPDINGQNGYDLDSGKEYNNGKSVQIRESSVEYTLQKPVANFLRQFDNEDMLSMFDDHVRVTVTRGKKKPKITTEEYSHD